MLWLPVASIAGAAVWMSAPVDPPVWLAAAIFVAGALLAALFALWPGEMRGLLWQTRCALAGVFAMASLAGLGGAAAQARTASLAAPPFEATEGAVIVEGWVSALEPGENGPRLRLLVRDIEGVAAPPRYVRIAVPERALLTPGRAARCRAELAPPAGPMAPGAYDFARRAFFQRLGAAGFSYGRCRAEAFGAPPSLYDRVQLRLAAIRFDLSASIQASAPGRGGAIAAALVTGDRSGVDDATNDALRNSGLGHLLSVSGVHMSIVGGLSFALMLWTLSLISPLALRWPVKKIAAAGALIVLALYLTISGGDVPAIRSYVMAAVAFGAILLDRPAISMRGLALAAFIIVLVFPESVLEPGFQMSFAATMALVALFEVMRRPHGDNLPTPGLLIGGLQWIARGIGGVMLISVVAGIATDPFAIYHFQRFSVYSLAANLAAEPIISFIVAPAAAAAAILAPFGYADIPLQIMSSALDLVAAIGDVFGNRPEAVRALPRPPDEAFALAVFALTWACLWKGWMRWGGVPLLGAAVALYLIAPRPIAAFDGDLRAVFARDVAAPWTLAQRGGRSTYARDRLGGMLGLAPAELERIAPPESCGEALCTWRTSGGHDVVLVKSADAFAQTCRPNAIVISSAPTPTSYEAQCPPAALIDATSLARVGGGFIYEENGHIRITRAAPSTIRRAWTPRGAGADD